MWFFGTRFSLSLVFLQNLAVWLNLSVCLFCFDHHDFQRDDRRRCGSDYYSATLCKHWFHETQLAWADVGCLVHLDWQPNHCNGPHEFLAPRGIFSLIQSPWTFAQCFQFVYFGRSIPWIIIDAIPYFRRWKLQPNKVPTAQEQWECTKMVLFSHFTIELPAVSLVSLCIWHSKLILSLRKIWLFHPMAENFGMSTWQVPFPSWTTMFPQIAIFFVFEDMFHYFGVWILRRPCSPYW